MEDLLNSITISDLPRHDRDVLSWFIKDATEPERVLQYVDEQHKDGGLPNLAYIVSLWKQVVTKGRYFSQKNHISIFNIFSASACALHSPSQICVILTRRP